MHRTCRLAAICRIFCPTTLAVSPPIFAYRKGGIFIHGIDVAKKPLDALAMIGVVFQQPTLDLDLSIDQNLRYHASLHGMSAKDSKARIDQALDRVELTAERATMVRKLSGGQRRRVEIGRALIHNPRFLLLDEPTVGLDISSRKGILTHVRALCRDTGIGVLWATHLLDEVEGNDHLIVLDKGVVKATGPVDTVIASCGAPTLGAAFTSLVGGGS